MRHARLESLVGGLPIRGPDFVSAELRDEGGNAVLNASHDGYVKRFGLMHVRRLWLSADGRTLKGVDILEPPKGKLRLKQDLPFAVHFHLHPSCRIAGSGHTRCTFRLPDGQMWTFACEEIPLSIEESLYFVDSAGPRPSLQIVLRGTTFGETEISWSVQADDAPA